MAKNNENSFWHEPAGEKLAGCLAILTFGMLLLCVASVIVYHYNHPKPIRHDNPWLNNDPSRPVTDIKELDYNRMLIIYRDEEPQKQLREFKQPLDCRMYDEAINFYEDHYEEIYEYFHD